MTDAAPGWEIRHFRIASSVVIAVAALLAGIARFVESQALDELAIALIVLAGGFRLLFEVFPRTHTRLITLHPKHFFLDTWRQLDAEAAAERAAQPEGKYDYRPLAALAFGAVCLAIMEYFGHSTTFLEVIDHYDPPFHEGPPTNFAGTIRNGQFLELWEFVWWSAFRVLGYLVLPALLVKIGFREKLRDQGLATKGFLEHAWIYVLGYCVVFVCVIFVSRNDENFQTYYPFYHYAGRSWLDFGCWEVLYAAQFFSLEFFFRGFWLRAMKRSMGSYAIFAMVVPYCMIHFSKPLAECLGAILAGVALGTLAMRTRSIWLGFAIHVSVALSMDIAALLQGEGLPHHFWPT